MTRLWILLSMSLTFFYPLTGHAQSDPVNCSLQYNLPADIPVPTNEATPDTFQQYAWRSFLALNAPGVGEADRLFFAPDGQHWVQYRSASPLFLQADQKNIEAILTLIFPSGSYRHLVNHPFRIWFTDNSELLYSNKV